MLIFDLLKKNKQFIKFAIVGASNTLITLITYNILVKIGVNYIFSNVIGYLFGVVNGFIWSKNWVFKSNGRVSVLFTKFVLVNLISLGLSTVILLLLVKYLYINKTVAQLMTTLVTVISNFALNKIWTFNSKVNLELKI